MLSATIGCTGPKYGAEVLHAVPALLNPVLVPIESGDVEAVQTAHVETPAAIEIAQTRPLRRGHDRRQVESLPHLRREGKRDAVRVGEAQIGEALSNAVAPLGRSRVPGAER